MRAPNGKLIIGVLESVLGTAWIGEDSTLDEIDYEGETKLCWDSQESVIKDGGRTFIDEDGHEWHEDQLKLAAVINAAIAPIQEGLQVNQTSSPKATQECKNCGGECPSSQDGCDGYSGDIDNLYGESND